MALCPSIKCDASHIVDYDFEADYRKPVSNVSLSDKEQIISVLLDYHLLIKVKCCIDQFIEGLEILNYLF